MTLRKHPVLFGAGGLAVLVGSITLGSGQLASATTPNATVNQGAPGSAPWPVSASGTVNVGNLPTTYPVSGSVKVSNLPAVQQVGAETVVMMDENGHNLVAGDALDTGGMPSDAYRTVKLYLSCTPTVLGDCANVQVTLSTTPNADYYSPTFTVDHFTAADNTTLSSTYEVPGDNIDLHVSNGASNPVTISYALEGRTG